MQSWSRWCRARLEETRTKGVIRAERRNLELAKRIFILFCFNLGLNYTSNNYVGVAIIKKTFFYNLGLMLTTSTTIIMMFNAEVIKIKDLSCNIIASGSVKVSQ